MNAEWIAKFDRAIALANQAMDEEIAEYHAQHGGSALSELEDCLQDEGLSRWHCVVKSLVLLRGELKQ